jgi:hypothetical protein
MSSFHLSFDIGAAASRIQTLIKADDGVCLKVPWWSSNWKSGLIPLMRDLPPLQSIRGVLMLFSPIRGGAGHMSSSLY